MRKLLLLAVAILSTGIASAENTTVNDTIVATNNGYINEGAPASKLIQSVWNMEIRTTTKYTRWGYIALPLDKVEDSASKIVFHVYLSGEKLATKNADGSLNVNSYTSDDLDGKDLKLTLNHLKYTFDSSITWESRTLPDETNEENLGDIAVDNNSKDTYLEWDLTVLAKQKKAAGDSHIYLRLEAKNSSEILRIRQVKITTGEQGAYYPRLIQTKAASSIVSDEADRLEIYPTLVTDEINIPVGSSVKIYDVQGKLVVNKTVDGQKINVTELKTGMYVLRNELGSVAKFVKK